MVLGGTGGGWLSLANAQETSAEGNSSRQAATGAAPSNAAAPAIQAAPLNAASSEQEGDPEEEDERKQNVVLRYLDGIFGYPRDPYQPRFIAYPVVGFAPETSWEFGLSGLYVYYARDDPSNRLSELSAFGFVTLAGQFGLHLEHALYSHRDRWFVLGEGHFQSFPLLYYGIGPDTDSVPDATIQERSVLIRERILHKIAPSLYVGPELAFDWIGKVRFDWEEGALGELPRGGNGSLNLAAGLGLVYDSRHNVLNVRDGLFSELAFLHSSPAWGSDFDFTVVESDTRIFTAMNARETLAAQVYGRFSFGAVPFNELSMLGGESLMRGHYLGRFRDRHLVAGQLEYRLLPFPFQGKFLRRFGGATFVSAGSVFSEDTGPDIWNFVVAGGAGLRFLLFPDKDIYTRGDVAFTAEGPGYYLYIGEAF